MSNKTFKDETEHPAYGMVRVGRISGGNGKFFGSHIKCNNYLTIEISQATKSNNLGKNWYFPKNEITKIKLTPAQFTEMITTTNGSGVPCTLEYVNGKRVENIPDDEKTEAQEAYTYFKDRMDETASTIEAHEKRLEEILSKKTVSKSDREEIRKQVSQMYTEIKSNMPFYLSQFDKATAKIVTDAKIEVESFTTHVIQQAGLDSIKRGDFPKMLGADNVE